MLNYRNITIFFVLFTFEFLGGYRVGFFTIKNIAIPLTVLLLFIPFLNGKRIKQTHISHSLIRWYCVYVLVYLITNVLSGEYFLNEEVLRNVMGSMLPCIVLFAFLNRYVIDRKSYLFVTSLLCLSCIADCIICVMQYNMSSLAWTIGETIREIDTEHLMSRFDKDYTAMSFIPGLQGSSVLAAYFVGGLGFLPLAFTRKYKYGTLVDIAMLVLVVYTLFILQERGPFFLYLLLFVFLVYKTQTMSISKLFIMIAVVIVITIVFITNDIQHDSFGRLLGDSGKEEPRSMIYATSLEYIKENFLLGGMTEFKRLVGFRPHNIVFNAFIAGGLFAGMIVCLITFRMIVDCGKSLFHCHRMTEKALMSCGLMLYLLNGFFHNASLVYGDDIIIILYVLVLKYEKIMTPSMSVSVTPGLLHSSLSLPSPKR